MSKELCLGCNTNKVQSLTIFSRVQNNPAHADEALVPDQFVP
uniref:Uncharacterized protein n=1 Tax=Arundo donax TaxID=35708 RepID=A0A0A9DQP5_ARUDO